MSARTTKKARPKPEKGADKTKMIRVDDDVRAYIVKRARWGESINTTLRRLFELPVDGAVKPRVAK